MILILALQRLLPRKSQEQKAQILALAEDFPWLWKDPGTTDRDRKRMARLILEDVTLNRDYCASTLQGWRHQSPETSDADQGVATTQD